MNINNDVEEESTKESYKKRALSEMFQKFSKGTRVGKWLIIVIALVIWLSSGIYIVAPAERGVVRQFGRFTTQTGPGLNFRLPWPIQAHDIVNVGAVRRAGIGFRTDHDGAHRRVDQEALMLTGDKNIANVQILVLYQVKDPVKYLFRFMNCIYFLEGLKSTRQLGFRSMQEVYDGCWL